MIRYKDRITLQQTRPDQWQLSSDQGSTYKMTAFTSVSDWWNNQCQSDIRSWQKDICVAETIQVFGKVEMFSLYQVGRGYKQNHDICLVKTLNYNFYILSTYSDFWITQSNQDKIIFDRSDSIGSCLEYKHRQQIYKIYKDLRQQYNPDYLCQYVRY